MSLAQLLLVYLGPLGTLLGVIAIAVTYLRGAAIKATIDAQTATISAMESRINVLEHELSIVTAERDGLTKQVETLKDVLGAGEAVKEQTKALNRMTETADARFAAIHADLTAIRRTLGTEDAHDR